MGWLPRAAALRCCAALWRRRSRPSPTIRACGPSRSASSPSASCLGAAAARGGGGLDAFASVPFSAGARSCIGKRFSLLEAKTVLAMILARFTPHSPPPRADEVVEAVTSRPKHGMRLSLRLRNDDLIAH
eukprot:COSAG01_NODE_1072_length_11863_cov_13.614587_5_plen_130_part_00